MRVQPQLSGGTGSHDRGGFFRSLLDSWAMMQFFFRGTQHQCRGLRLMDPVPLTEWQWSYASASLRDI